MRTCKQTLVIQPYGGGHRYHCPVCDVRKNIYGLTMATWTNGEPASDMCQNKKKHTRMVLSTITNYETV